MRKCEYAEMKWPLWILIIAFLPACEIDDLPLETRDEAKVWVQQPPLFTDVRVEPDQVWEKQIGGRNISWRYNSIKEELEKSILIIGIFEITFFNTNIDQAVNAEVMINLIGADGFRHLPQTLRGPLQNHPQRQPLRLPIGAPATPEDQLWRHGGNCPAAACR